MQLSKLLEITWKNTVEPSKIIIYKRSQEMTQKNQVR